MIEFEKIEGVDFMSKQTIYWRVDYKDSFDTMDDLVGGNEDLCIVELLEVEYACLIKHDYRIILTDYDNMYFIIEMKIPIAEDIAKTYKNYDLVPYVEVKPTMALTRQTGVYITYNNIKYQIK